MLLLFLVVGESLRGGRVERGDVCWWVCAGMGQLVGGGRQSVSVDDSMSVCGWVRVVQCVCGSGEQWE